MSDPNNNSSSGVGVAEEIIQKFVIKSMEERSLSVLNGKKHTKQPNQN